MTEDWLIDIETTANLTSESRTKLAQAKSKGLTHMLISEALNLDKSWDEIKDLLHLKIHNLDIHISVSHFIFIQQNNKESLAATYTDLKERPKGATSTTMQPQFRYSSKDLKTPTL